MDRIILCVECSTILGAYNFFFYCILQKIWTVCGLEINSYLHRGTHRGFGKRGELGRPRAAGEDPEADVPRRAAFKDGDAWRENRKRKCLWEPGAGTVRVVLECDVPASPSGKGTSVGHAVLPAGQLHRLPRIFLIFPVRIRLWPQVRFHWPPDPPLRLGPAGLGLLGSQVTSRRRGC